MFMFPQIVMLARMQEEARLRRRAAQNAAVRGQTAHSGHVQSSQLTASQRAQAFDAHDMLSPLNPVNPLSVVSPQHHSIFHDAVPRRECSAPEPSYDPEPTRSSSNSSCSSWGSSYDSGSSSSSYDSGSSSSSSSYD